MPPISGPLGADASESLASAAPTFGSLLESVGMAVATSQSALDNALVTNVNALSNTNITVVTDVIIRLDDDGMPMTPNPARDLVKTEVSVLNYFMPTVHEWRRVAVSMDLTVGAFSSQDGMTFERKQYSGSVGGAGLFWGFLGWFDMSTSEAEQSGHSLTQRETNFAQGEVRMDAHLAPRRSQGFKAPLNATKGPQLVISQVGSRDIKDSDDRIIARETDVIVHVLTAAGADNAGRSVTVESNGLQVSYADTGGYTGSTTNTQGRIKVTLRRGIAGPLFAASRRFPVTAALGQVRRTMNITL